LSRDGFEETKLGFFPIQFHHRYIAQSARSLLMLAALVNEASRPLTVSTLKLLKGNTACQINVISIS
jgi:hypothetical protein